MTKALETHHPLLMVPHVYTLGVVIYTNGDMPAHQSFPSPDVIRDAIARSLPVGTGVGAVTVMNHGVYDGKQGAS